MFMVWAVIRYMKLLNHLELLQCVLRVCCQINLVHTVHAHFVWPMGEKGIFETCEHYTVVNSQ